MTEAMDDYFAKKGKMTKHILITTATIIGSLTVILGGAKIILGWFGFNYMSK